MSNDYARFKVRQFPSRRSRNRARKKLLDSLLIDRRNAFSEAEAADIKATKADRAIIGKRLSNEGGFITSSPKPEDRNQ
jgi:hypothetical protein